MTLKKIVLSLCVISLSQSAFAADIAAGKEASKVCVACHGAAGISSAEIWPNLAGQKMGYLVKQINAFKDGTRTDPSMSAMIKLLADDQIENVAAFYSSLK